MPEFLRVEFDDRKVRKALAAMGKAREELGVVFRALAPPLRKNLMGHAERNESPDGQPWEPRAASTVARLSKRASFVYADRGRRGRRRSGPRQQVRFTKPLGRLPLSVKTRSGGKRLELVARSTVRWSGAHNEGATVGHGARLPARPFVDWDDDFLDLATTKIVGFIHARWEAA